MTPERFQALLGAYGADPQHWPESERAAGQALAAQLAPAQRAPWAEAAWLDEWLASHTLAAPNEALVQRIVADAATVASPVAAPQGEPNRPRQAPWWWPGARFAGLGLAGALAGAFAGAFVVSAALRTGAPPAAGDWFERATAFSELPKDWSEE